MLNEAISPENASPFASFVQGLVRRRRERRLEQWNLNLFLKPNLKTNSSDIDLAFAEGGLSNHGLHLVDAIGAF